MDKFLFGVHLHQPVDNLKIAIDKAVEKCYAPLFETFSKYPEFKLNLHCSGWLFQKLKDDYNEVFENIKKSNIEFFSGGFYEPILAIIPREDRIVQITKLNTFIYDNFRVKPKGLWLTERVWSDDIISEIVDTNIEYMIIDDFHLYSAGIKTIKGSYITENNGKKIKLFPISKKLRYSIPFLDVDEVIKIIENEAFALLFDDGEKFGLWPQTYKLVYEDKWLEKFIESVLEKTIHFNQISSNPQGVVYIPEVSYPEMQEWCKNLDNTNQIAVFKNFFSKYKESNHLHKRMLNLSSIKNESLYKLQTNDVFWHGVFGGLYLPNLRDNAYRYLIECEEYFEDRFQIDDIDLDGKDEIKIKNDTFIVIFNSNGELIEFDDIKNRFNFLNTLKRRKEKYHFEIQNKVDKKVATIHEISLDLGNLKSELFFDRYFRYSFIDHLVKEINIETFKQDSFDDYFNKSLIQNGLIFENNQIKKTIHVDNDIEFEIINKTEYKYALEFNFHFAHYDELEINQKYIYDSYTNRKIIFDFKSEEMLYFYVNTISRDEKGFNKTIQCISLLFLFETKTIRGRVCLK